MMTILFSFLMGLLIILYPVAEPSLPYLLFLSSLIATATIMTWVACLLMYAQALTPLQKAGQNLTPHLLTMLGKDSPILFIRVSVNIFVLFSFTIAFYLLFQNPLLAHHFFGIWIIVLGFVTHLLQYFLNRITSYLNPFDSIKAFSREAIKAIRNEKDQDLYQWIDALSEVSLKAIQCPSPSLVDETVNQLQLIGKLFLETSKSLTHHEKESQVSYTLYYLFQQLEFIWNNALKNHLEFNCSHLITAMSKMIVHAAKYDMTMTSHPLYFLQKFIKEAQKANMSDIPLKASLALLEVARVIGTELDMTYVSIQETFFSIISQLEEIAKETFRQDKTTSIKILTQPFRELKTLFNAEKLSKHQDTPMIIADLDRILSEFNALELVMKTVPPIPSFNEEPSTQTPPLQK